MPDFSLPDSPYKYRPLKRGDTGWDVYALQTTLNRWAAGQGLTPLLDEDGIFGGRTDRRTRTFQRRNKLPIDGIAGILTQRKSCLEITPSGPWPDNVAVGLYEFEGGFQLGNHTDLYSSGSRDFSVVQDNLPDSERQIGFHVPGRIDYYFDELLKNYTRYRNSSTQPSTRRAWELAVGWWNRPAWTDRLAAGKTITSEQSDWIESYIDRITTYVNW